MSTAREQMLARQDEREAEREARKQERDAARVERDAARAERNAERGLGNAGANAGGQNATPTPTPNPTSTTTGIDARVAEITSSNSPLMQQARTQGLEAANRRGLANSSIAVGAAEDAALRAALPIASQESQEANALNQTQLQIQANKELKQLDIATQKQLAAQDVASRENLARIQSAGNDRSQLASAISNLSAQRYNAIANTLNNPEIPASVRAATQKAINDQYDAAINQLQNLYGVAISSAPVTAAP